MSYYAVAKGKNVGIFLSFDDCNKAIKGFKNPIMKKFKTLKECEEFIIKNKNSKNVLKEEYKSFDIKFDNNIINEVKNKANEKKIVTIDDKKQKKRKKEEKQKKNEEYEEYEENEKNTLEIYTDGCCINNGRANAAAGIGIYFGPGDKRNVSKKISGKQTNNTAELTAIIYSFKALKNEINNGRNIIIHSDSEYSIKCATSYGKKMEKNEWKKDIPNKELVQMIYSLYSNTPNVQLKHIRAHTGKQDKHSIGNENADRLANEAVVRNNFTPFEKKRNESKRKIYLNVPYTQRNEVKKLGGRWDPNKKKWFIYENNKNKGNIIGRFSL